MVGPGQTPRPGVQEVSSPLGDGEREHSRPLAGGWRVGTSVRAQVCFAKHVQLRTHVTSHSSEESLSVCDQLSDFGGVKNSEVAIYPFKPQGQPLLRNLPV